MRTGVPLLLALAAWAAVGCSHTGPSRRPPEPAAGSAAPGPVEPSAVEVPLPAETPFDADPKARAAYLEFFAKGYRLAASGYAVPGCICSTSGEIADFEAMAAGYLAGVEAGTPPSGEAPAPATAAASPATSAPAAR